MYLFCRIRYYIKKDTHLELLMLVALNLIGTDISARQLENIKPINQAKAIAREVEKSSKILLKNDSDWTDKYGLVNRLSLNPNSDGYYPIDITNKGYDANNITNVLINPNSAFEIQVIIEATVDNENYYETFSINKIEKEELMPMILAKNGHMHNNKFSSFNYSDSINKDCMSSPSFNLYYSVDLEIDALNIISPKQPCGSKEKNISLFFEKFANLNNIHYIDNVYSQGGASLFNTELEELHIGNNNYNANKNSTVKLVDKNSSYQFPSLNNFKQNKLNLSSIKQSKDKRCRNKEVLYLGNGSINKLTIEDGCVSLVFTGMQYDINELVLEIGTKTSIEFSGATTLNVKDITLQTFSELYLVASNPKSDRLTIYAENINIGEGGQGPLNMQEINGNSKLECEYPETCLLDTNKLIVIDNSSLLAYTIARDTALISHSTFRGALLANMLIAENSHLSNFVSQNGTQVFNKLFYEKLKLSTKNGFEDFFNYSSTKKCNGISNCKLSQNKHHRNTEKHNKSLHITVPIPKGNKNSTSFRNRKKQSDMIFGLK